MPVEHPTLVAILQTLWFVGGDPYPYRGNVMETPGIRCRYCQMLMHPSILIEGSKAWGTLGHAEHCPWALARTHRAWIGQMLGYSVEDSWED